MLKLPFIVLLFNGQKVAGGTFFLPNASASKSCFTSKASFVRSWGRRRVHHCQDSINWKQLQR